jgi:hypothetical protein
VLVERVALHLFSKCIEAGDSLKAALCQVLGQSGFLLMHKPFRSIEVSVSQQIGAVRALLSSRYPLRGPFAAHDRNRVLVLSTEGQLTRVAVSGRVRVLVGPRTPADGRALPAPLVSSRSLHSRICPLISPRLGLLTAGPRCLAGGRVRAVLGRSLLLQGSARHPRLRSLLSCMANLLNLGAPR